MKQIVLLPIQVPDSEYCWKYDGSSICEFFDNEGGHEKCEYNIGSPIRTNDGAKKPKECQCLTVGTVNTKEV